MKERCKPDTEILGVLLLLQATLHVTESEEGLGEMVARGLARVPGVAFARLRLEKHRPEWGEEARGPWPHGELVAFPLQTGLGVYGSLEVCVAQGELFAPYEPFVRNLTNVVALWLENWEQRRHLDRLVRERTAELERQRERAEALAASLSREHERLKAILDLLPVPLLLLEPTSGRVVFANCAAHRMAGGSLPRALSAEGAERAFQWTDEQDRPLPTEQGLGARAARHECLQGAELVWHTPAGRFSLLSDSALLPPTAGYPEAVLLMLQDVTQLKAAEKEAQRAVKLRDEFLSVASHELKTPLTSLKLQCELIGRNLEQQVAARLLPRLSSAMRQVGRLASLVDRLLDVSRISSGQLTLEPMELDLTQVTREALDRLKEMFAQSKTTVDFPPTPPVHGYWDPLRLEQVLVNLLSNAAKYGAGKPVHVRIEADAEHAWVSVLDEGIGISSEALGRIFHRFERAVSDRHYGGLGLGLFISQQLIEAMGGSIRAESTLGQGSAFTVELPRGAPR